MSQIRLNGEQQTLVTETATEAYSILQASFDSIEIEIDKLRDQLPPEFEKDVDALVNKVYHQAVETMASVRDDILNLNHEVEEEGETGI